MLKLYNTMSRKTERFAPRNPQSVKMFTCGPSIYRRPHIGNYRSFLWEDVLQRYLEHKGYQVERVINFTDVEDKSLAEAEKEGVSVEKLTGSIAEQFHDDCKLLHIKLPDFIPRSSTCVDQAVELIQVLLQKGHAYRHGVDVFYDPLKFKGFGKLFRLDMKRWPKEKRRFRRDTYPGRRWNLGDFILWHGQRDGDVLYWDTPIGKGRPAWNIQDPAIITKHLGYTIDIACGGIDNLYRHHDYNIAVIEAVSGEEFARYWVHGGHLLADGKKMSKSRGNIIYPEDLLSRGLSGQHIRFYLIYGHHGKDMNLTQEHLHAAADQLSSLRQSLAELGVATNLSDKTDADARKLIGELANGFIEAMDQNLNVKLAVDGLRQKLNRLCQMKQKGMLRKEDIETIHDALKKMDQVLQVVFPQ